MFSSAHQGVMAWLLLWQRQSRQDSLHWLSLSLTEARGHDNRTDPPCESALDVFVDPISAAAVMGRCFMFQSSLELFWTFGTRVKY